MEGLFVIFSRFHACRTSGDIVSIKLPHIYNSVFTELGYCNLGQSVHKNLYFNFVTAKPQDKSHAFSFFWSAFDERSIGSQSIRPTLKTREVIKVAQESQAFYQLG